MTRSWARDSTARNDAILLPRILACIGLVLTIGYPLSLQVESGTTGEAWTWAMTAVGLLTAGAFGMALWAIDRHPRLTAFGLLAGAALVLIVQADLWAAAALVLALAAADTWHTRRAGLLA